MFLKSTESDLNSLPLAGGAPLCVPGSLSGWTPPHRPCPRHPAPGLVSFALTHKSDSALRAFTLAVPLLGPGFLPSQDHPFILQFLSERSFPSEVIIFLFIHSFIQEMFPQAHAQHCVSTRKKIQKLCLLEPNPGCW